VLSMTAAYETVAASGPKVGFAGREASRDVLRGPARKEGVRGGTMGSRTVGKLLP
jgi:hypothetical protein